MLRKRTTRLLFSTSARISVHVNNRQKILNKLDLRACTFVRTLINMHAKVLVADFQEPHVATLVLRKDQLTKFRRIKGQGLEVDATFADRIGVNPGQVSRVLKNKSAPGTRFIAGCLDLFGVECFADLFAVEPDDNGSEAA